MRWSSATWLRRPETRSGRCRRAVRSATCRSLTAVSPARVEFPSVGLLVLSDSVLPTSPKRSSSYCSRDTVGSLGFLGSGSLPTRLCGCCGQRCRAVFGALRAGLRSRCSGACGGVARGLLQMVFSGSVVVNRLGAPTRCPGSAGGRSAALGAGAPPLSRSARPGVGGLALGPADDPDRVFARGLRSASSRPRVLDFLPRLGVPVAFALAARGLDRGGASVCSRRLIRALGWAGFVVLCTCRRLSFGVA